MDSSIGDRGEEDVDPSVLPRSMAVPSIAAHGGSRLAAPQKVQHLCQLRCWGPHWALDKRHEIDPLAFNQRHCL